MTGMGAFETNAYDTTFAGSFIWVVWWIETVLIKIILLTVIVSNMNFTHDSMQENIELSKLQEYCSLMYDYEFTMNRDREFKNAKYIVIAKLQKGT
jgi:hypothetical protein